VESKVKDEKNKIIKYLSSKNGVKIILAVGIIGMALIFLSDIFAKKEEKPTINSDETAVQGVSAQELEERIKDIVESIAGVGKAKVMITYLSDVEKVYAKESNESVDITREDDGAGGIRTEERKETTNEYVIIENSAGRKDALLITTMEPQIRGVVVVCSGGGNGNVEARVVGAVTVALGIPSTKVYVTELKE